MSQSWMILSGKGGVGKSTIASSLGLLVARRLFACCCIDLDLGLRSLDMLLGMQNEVVYDVMDVVHKDCKLRAALVQHADCEPLSLLPAAQLLGDDELTARDLSRIVHKLKRRFAYIFMDSPAGVGPDVQKAVSLTDRSLLVVTPDDLCIRDAERVVAMLDEAGKPRPLLIVNRVIPDLVASGSLYDPQTVALTLDLPLLGYVPEDQAVISATNRHESFLLQECPAHDAMERIARRFLGEPVEMPSPALQKRGRASRRGGDKPLAL